MWKRLALALLAALLLSGCAGKEPEDRAAALQSRYAALGGWEARVAVSVPKNGTLRRYVLDLSRSENETRATVAEPGELAGLGASILGDALSVRWDGMVLDAGSAAPGVSALNAADLAVRAAGSGWILEQSRESLDGAEALRLCLETGAAGEKLLCTAYFDDQDRLLYAELEENGEIVAYLEFTDFTFGAILESAENDTNDT